MRASRTVNRLRRARESRGYALLAALLLVALVSLAAGIAVQSQRQNAQREREAQLLFIGGEFRRALQSYHSYPAGGQQYPASLDDLVLDRRAPVVVRHLRKVYADPMTGEKDWVLQLQQGRIVGVHSRSTDMPLQHAGFSKENQGFASAEHYAQWTFMAVAGLASGSLAEASALGPGSANGAGSATPAVTGNSGTPSVPGSEAPGTNVTGGPTSPPGDGNPAPPPTPTIGSVGDCRQNYIFTQNNCNDKPPPMGTDYASCRAALQDAYNSCVASFQ